MALSKNAKVLLISNAIEATFSSSEWIELSLLTESSEYIDNHPRLLRSLHWGDQDYKGHVIDAVSLILDEYDGSLRILIEYEPIAEWLANNHHAELEMMRSEVFGLEVPEAIPSTPSESAIKALADAQVLLETTGPSSAVDRVHTGLHGYLRGCCKEIGLEPQADASANQLLKQLLSNHPALQELGPRGEDIHRILRTSAAIVDAMGSIRNRASLAHPNDELLDEESALLVINVSRSLLRFLDAKLRR